MKTFLTLLAIVPFLSNTKAQTGTVNISDCYIRYQYDNAGNRIKRDFYCYTNPQWSYKTMPSDSLETITDDLKVYPNPSSLSFTVALPIEIENAEATLFNVAGQVLKTQTLNSNVSVINVTELPAGIYMLVVNSNGKNTIEG